MAAAPSRSRSARSAYACTLCHGLCSHEEASTVLCRVVGGCTGWPISEKGQRHHLADAVHRVESMRVQGRCRGPDEWGARRLRRHHQPVEYARDMLPIPKGKGLLGSLPPPTEGLPQGPARPLEYSWPRSRRGPAPTRSSCRRGAAHRGSFVGVRRTPYSPASSTPAT